MTGRVLYWVSGSPFAWRARAVLAEKGLTYESKELDRGEMKSDEVLAINPRGQVPTFKDGDAVVNESLAMMQYVEDVYPENPLLPDAADQVKRALAYQRFHETSSLYSAIQPLYYVKMIGAVSTEEEQEKFQEGLQKAHKELSWFESYLADGSSHLVGDMFTLGDISLAIALFFVQRAGATLQRYPHMVAYADRLRERPGLKETWPQDWLETDGNDFLEGL